MPLNLCSFCLCLQSASITCNTIPRVFEQCWVINSGLSMVGRHTTKWAISASTWHLRHQSKYILVLSLPLKQHKYNVTYGNGLFLLIWRGTLLAIFQVLLVPSAEERSWIVNHMPCESRTFNLHVGKTEREARRFHCSLLNVITPPESWRVLVAVHEAYHVYSKEYGVLQEPEDLVGSWPLQYLTRTCLFIEASRSTVSTAALAISAWSLSVKRWVSQGSRVSVVSMGKDKGTAWKCWWPKPFVTSRGTGWSDQFSSTM